MDLGLIRQDGLTQYVLDDADFTTTAETRKGKNGEIVETGVTKRVFLYRKTAAQIGDGEGATAVLPDGKAAVVRELRITERYLDADAVAAKGEADKVKRIVTNLRLYLGLSKSKKAVADRDKLVPQDVANWMNGDRTLFGKRFDSLASEMQAAVSKVYAESIKAPKSKAPTDAQFAELFRLAAENGTPLDPADLEAYNKHKADKAERLAKMQAAKAKA